MPSLTTRSTKLRRSMFILGCSMFALPLLASPFTVEKIPNPPAVDPQIGGLDVLSDGRIAATFHRGEIQIFDPATRLWTPFAAGLQEPLGLVAESDSSFVVMQRTELTKIEDTDGDGLADLYRTLWDDFGVSGNYHEFAFGPAKGPDGSYYVGLNVASNGAPVRPEIRGEWSEIGELDREQMTSGKSDWGKVKNKAGRMYSRVPFRGWIMKVSPDGKAAEPFASGFRSPDGLGFNAAGNLLVTDNQGDWRGTSPLYTVEKDGFYGHPASLVWKDGWDGQNPLKMKTSEFEELRTEASAFFPQGELANSPTQPVIIPDSWGPYAGQVVIGDMNQPHLVRYLADPVGGVHQGGLVPMVAHPQLGNGNHRLVFDQDGALWIGKTHLSWAGAEGLVKVTLPEPDEVFTLTSAKLGKDGDLHTFTLDFSQPLADDPEAPAIKRYRYNYTKDYGSPQVDKAEAPTRGLQLSPDGKTLTVRLEAKQGFVHQIDLSKFLSKSGHPIEGATLYYQVNALP